MIPKARRNGLRLLITPDTIVRWHRDIAACGWSEAPPRRLVFAADVPKLGQPLPRALPPDASHFKYHAGTAAKLVLAD